MSRSFEAMEKAQRAAWWRQERTKALWPLNVVIQALLKLEASSGECGEDRTAERCGHILLAVATAVAKRDDGLLIRLEVAATGGAAGVELGRQEAKRSSDRAQTRHRAIVVATVRGAIRHEEPFCAGDWADCRAVVSRVLRGRMRTTHAEITDAVAELEAAGEIERREVDGRGQVRLSVSALQVGMFR